MGDSLRVKRVTESAFQTLRAVYQPTAAAIAIKSCADQFDGLVALIEDELVGAVEYQESTNGIHLRSLAVQPSTQGKGVARELIDVLATKAREGGGKLLTLHTIRETGNVDFFNRLNFREVSEEIATWAASESLHEVYMERSL